MKAEPNVWTVNAAVNEVMRLRALVRRLGDREDELRILVDDLRWRAHEFRDGTPLHIEIDLAATKLHFRLLPAETFEPRGG